MKIISAAIGLVMVTLGAPASAMFGAPRYAVCRSRPRPQATPPDELLPLPERRPRILAGEELVVIDVAQVAPMPGRDATEKPPPFVAQTDIDFRCVGIPKATQTIRDVIAAPPGTRWHRRDAADWRVLHLRAAGAFGITGVRPSIRRELERPLPGGAITARHFDAFRVKLAAAHAAADLHDTAAAPLVLAFLEEREGKPAPLIWEEGLGALARVDAVQAQAYATKVLRRLRDARERQAHPNMLRRTLALVTRADPRTLAALQAVSKQLVEPDGDPDGTDACRVLAARVRAGDQALAKELRPELATDLRTQRGVLCYSYLIDVVFPGAASDEVPVLTHRHRYRTILRLIERMADAPDASWPARRKELEAWLHQQSTSPRIAGGRRHRDYQPSTRARHLAARAALGERAARDQLLEMVTDEDDDDATPFVAARLALRFGLPGAADAAAQRMRMAIGRHHDHFGRDPWRHRGRLVITEHVRLMEAMREAGDPRFALSLLDRQGHARAATTFALARFRGDRGAVCHAVLRAAETEGVHADAIDEGLWALSAYGRTCVAEAERLAKEGPLVARGMASELLAMAHRLKRIDEAPRGAHRVRAALKRARGIQRVPWPARTR